MNLFHVETLEFECVLQILCPCAAKSFLSFSLRLFQIHIPRLKQQFLESEARMELRHFPQLEEKKIKNRGIPGVNFDL